MSMLRSRKVGECSGFWFSEDNLAEAPGTSYINKLAKYIALSFYIKLSPGVFMGQPKKLWI